MIFVVELCYGVHMKTSPQLDRFTQYVDKSIIESIYQKASLLAGLHILHFNTTATGGGVAEILSEITPITEEFGIQQTRQIIELDDTSNHFTGRLVDMLQGNVAGKFRSRSVTSL